MAKNRFFDLSAIKDPTPVEDPERHYKSKFLLAHFENVNKLEGNLKRLPSEEEFFFLQTNNSFNAFTFIPFVCKYVTVRRLFASTYSISRKVIEALMELQRTGLVGEITLLISDSMVKRNPMTIDVLLAVAATNGNLKVLFGWNHSKVCLLEASPSPSKGGESQYFVIEGSGNWADNAQMEQYTFANCKGLYDFRMDLFAPEKARQIAAGGHLEKVISRQ
ncbi:hypothetical protein [Salinimicrobium sp. WS361]|uniref:hypothetical protein n=1 Tax=Salinimicrobium sp. WS361 TaxID=3425123 RepID=UPI003D6EE29D